MSRRARAANCPIDKPPVSSTNSFRFCSLIEIVGADAAAPDLVGGNAGLLGDDTRGELLGRHFQREEADDAAIGRFGMAVGAYIALPGIGDVEGDVGRQRRLAHAGTARQHDQIGFLQAAHHLVEVVETGGDA